MRRVLFLLSHEKTVVAVSAAARPPPWLCCEGALSQAVWLAGVGAAWLSQRGGGGRGLSPPMPSSLQGAQPRPQPPGDSGARGDLGRQGAAQPSPAARPRHPLWLLCGVQPHPGVGGMGRAPRTPVALTQRPPVVTTWGHSGPSADRAHPRFFNVQPLSRALNTCSPRVVLYSPFS